MRVKCSHLNILFLYPILQPSTTSHCVASMVHFDNPEPFSTPITPSSSRRPSMPIAPHVQGSSQESSSSQPESLQPDTILAAVEPQDMTTRPHLRKSSAAVFRGLEHGFDTQAEDLPEEFRTTQTQPKGRERKPGAVLAHYAFDNLRRASSVVPELSRLVPDAVKSAAEVFHDAGSELRSGTAGFPRLFKGEEYRPFVSTVPRSKQHQTPDGFGNYPDRTGPKNGHLDDSNSEDDDGERNLRTKLGRAPSSRRTKRPRTDNHTQQLSSPAGSSF